MSIATSPYNQGYEARTGTVILPDPADDSLTIVRARLSAAFTYHFVNLSIYFFVVVITCSSLQITSNGLIL